MTDVHSIQPTPLQDRLVLVADDHLLVRDGLKLLVGSILGTVRFVEACDAASLLAMAAVQPAPCLALVDLNMPGMDKGHGLAQLAHHHPALPVVVISALTSPDVVRRTLSLGNVHAFVPKSATVEHMRVAIAAALAGRKLPFSQAVDAGGGTADIQLSPRLEEIRALVRQGMSNKLIASQLGISEGTVKNYMSDIFKALKVSNRTQAARFDPDTA